MGNNKLIGKKLLILAGNDVHVKVVQAAKELGVYTIVTDYFPLESSPAKQIADEYWNLSTNDIDAVVQRCRKEHVDGVLNFCIDTIQKAYQEICAKLNLPCYGTKELFNIFTNKRLFKEYLIQHDVDVIPEYTMQQVESGDCAYPLLVKPSDSRGSRGITICKEPRDVPDAIAYAQAESRDGHVLMEQYMKGEGIDDMAFAYMIIGGKPYLTKICDRVLGYEEDHLQCQQMASILPSKHTAEYIEKVHPKVVKMIQSLQIPFGVIFLQGIWKNGSVYMYDPGVRFPGTDFDIAAKHVTGFDSMKAFVEFAITGNVKACYGNPALSYTYNGQTCIILSFSCKGGIIKAFEGVEQLQVDNRIMSLRQIYKAGDQVPVTGDIRQRVLEIVAILPNKQDIPAFLKEVYEKVHIWDEKGDDMIISKVKYTVENS